MIQLFRGRKENSLAENGNIPQKVVLSTEAYLFMLSETYAFPKIETGGIFLGFIENGIWYVIENIDPGFKNVERSYANFEYDVDYVNHLANVRKRIYAKNLVLLGLWHRHPGSMDVFSSTDTVTNKTFADLSPEGAVSAIVNLDPDFRITMYHVSHSLQYSVVKNVEFGDSLIPPELKALKKPEEIIARAARKAPMPVSKSQEAVIQIVEHEMEFIRKQRDYERKIQMTGDRIELKMKRRSDDNNLPASIECQFMIENDMAYIIINGIKQPYKKLIVKDYIEQNTKKEPDHEAQN